MQKINQHQNKNNRHRPLQLKSRVNCMHQSNQMAKEIRQSDNIRYINKNNKQVEKRQRRSVQSHKGIKLLGNIQAINNKKIDRSLEYNISRNLRNSQAISSTDELLEYPKLVYHSSEKTQSRCLSLSKQRNKHKYEKLAKQENNSALKNQTKKSDLISNICELEQQFDELVMRKNQTSYQDNYINQRKHQPWKIDKYFDYPKQEEDFEWTNRSGKRSLALMNRYAPKSTINLLDGKYMRYQNQQNYRNSLNRQQKPPQFQKNQLSKSSATSYLANSTKNYERWGSSSNRICHNNSSQSLQVIPIGHSISKKSLRNSNTELFSLQILNQNSITINSKLKASLHSQYSLQDFNKSRKQNMNTKNIKIKSKKIYNYLQKEVQMSQARRLLKIIIGNLQQRDE